MVGRREREKSGLMIEQFSGRRIMGLVGGSWCMWQPFFLIPLPKLVALIIPNITLRQRLPLRNVSGGLFNFQAFKNPPFLAYAIAAFTGFLGLYTVPTYIELSALAVSVLPNIAIYLVAIANAGTGLGSLFAVIMMDRIGMIMAVGAAGALCGMPISGAINQLTEDFHNWSATVVSVGFMVLTRLLVLKKLRGKF
ncbi:hypothetical protein F5876DRAFT_91740 [Lentinula aff. lateritia]|uniref:Uncharacterized protein n=1 Tax=Lentinula aff. lateritia TaxID=2804960 RepID=A0ACC1TJQ9_9AGAR|nr:hypothetical protein F5876DRAFT_91740 [Lentinula aff. lateritia]